MRFLRRNEPEAREEDLAALADGSLPPARRATLEARLEASPELAALLEEQQRALSAVRGAAVSVEAPARLRGRVEEERRSPAAPSRRLVWGAGLAAAAAVAAAIVLVLALPANVPGGPTIAEAAVLATRPAVEPAPAPEPGRKTLLARSVEGVPYPSWAAKFGWTATGARVDTLGGRSATTVFYEKGGRRIGYTIIAGDALRVPGDASGLRREGVELRFLTVAGGPVVTWLRAGHTCLLSGAGVGRDVLAKLAAWKGKGTVPF